MDSWFNKESANKAFGVICLRLLTGRKNKVVITDLYFKCQVIAVTSYFYLDWEVGGHTPFTARESEPNGKGNVLRLPWWPRG